MKLIDLDALKYFYAKLEQVLTTMVSVNEQELTDEQKAQARENIGVGESDFSGDFNDLKNKPQATGATNIPASKTIKSWNEKDGVVSITTQDISIKKENISDFEHKHTVADITDIDDKGFATEQYVDSAIEALPSPMVFKGSLGTNGTITTLPSAAKANTGFTYKVITDGTYASQKAKIGDMFISDGSAWIYIPSADEENGTVTSVGVTVPTGLKVTNSPVTTAGTIDISMDTGYSIPTDVKQGQWDTAYTHSQSTHARTDATKVEASTTNGNIKINGTETTVYAHPTATSKTGGLYKVAVNGTGHVSSATAVTKDDITALGIPAQDTTYSIKGAVSGGQEASLVSTGEKYSWNNKETADNKITSWSTTASNVKYPSEKLVKDAIDELKNSVSDGKSSIASAITNNGVTTASDATFATMATNIGTVATNKYNKGVSDTKVGTATAANVLSGKTFTNSSSVGVSGTMKNNGAVNASVGYDGTYTIPAGYHNGSGKVTSTVTSGSINNAATAGVTYTENKDASTVVPAEGALYINAGYIPNTKITLGHMIPDDEGYENAGSDKIRSGYEAYDSDGKKLIGTIADVAVPTPSLSVANDGTVTASASQTAGYSEGGTKSNTKAVVPTSTSVDKAGNVNVYLNSQTTTPVYTTTTANSYNAGVSATKVGTAVASNVLSGKTFTNSSGVGVAGSMTNNGAVSKSIGYGESYTVPAGYHDGTGKVTNSVGAGTITSGSATISSASYAYDSTNKNFKVTGSATISAPTVGTAGYVSSTAGTKNTNTASLSTTVATVGVKSTHSGTTTVTPVISKVAKPTGDTWTDGAGGNATTTKPTSGAYIEVQSAANTGTLTSTPAVSSAGYGTTTNYTATNGTSTVGANASAATYVPVKGGSATTPSASGASTSTSLSGTTLTVARSVTPTVSAGWVSSGTAGTVTITGTVPTQTKSATPSTSSQTISPDSGKLLSSVTVNAMPSGSFNNAATSGVTYTENTADATVIPAEGALYINAGYIPNTKITLAHLIPDDASYTNAGTGQIRKGYEAYDTNGKKLIGTIADVTPSFTGGTASLTGTSNAITTNMATATSGDYYIDATAKAKATRTAVTYNGAATGYINVASGTSASAANTSSEGSISATRIYIPKAAGSVTMSAGSGSVTGSNVTLSDTNNGISVTGKGSVSATAKVTTAGYTPTNSSFATGSSTSSNSATKYITGVTVPKDQPFSVTTTADTALDTTSNLTVTNAAYRQVAITNASGGDVNITNSGQNDYTAGGSTAGTLTVNAYNNASSPALTGAKTVVSNGKWSRTSLGATSSTGTYYGAIDFTQPTQKGAATYNTSTSDQTISAGNYISGTQTIKAVKTSNIDAGNIKKGVTVTVGDANSAGRIKNVTGTLDYIKTVTSVPSTKDTSIIYNSSTGKFYLWK